jgi:hypothetical protein
MPPRSSKCDFPYCSRIINARRTFTLLQDEDGITMKYKDESGELLPVSGEMVLWSILARKP